MKRILNNNGFTLMEVIISIATIAIISSFILQMFLTSAHVNQTAKYNDICLAKAISTIELFKSGDTPTAILDYEQYSTIYDLIKKEDSINFSIFYDENLNVINANGYSDPFKEHGKVVFVEHVAIRKSDVFKIEEPQPRTLSKTFIIGSDNIDSGIITGETYLINVIVEGNSSQMGSTPYISLENEKYFVYEKTR